MKDAVKHQFIMYANHDIIVDGGCNNSGAPGTCCVVGYNGCSYFVRLEYHIKSFQ